MKSNKINVSGIFDDKIQGKHVNTPACLQF